VLQGNLRRIDTLGRLGGEEFAVLLPATTLAGAAELAERLRLAVQESPAVIAAQGGRPATEVAFTISVGVAALDPRQPRTEQVLKHADVAMYEAKSTGRNKVCVSPPAAAAPVQTATS
jgi:diguanylate cyclase (GGDEF)-like protein